MAKLSTDTDNYRSLQLNLLPLQVSNYLPLSHDREMRLRRL
jgi:hypothetical protein